MEWFCIPAALKKSPVLLIYQIMLDQ